MPALYASAAMAVAQGVSTMANSDSPTASAGPYGSSGAQSGSSSGGWSPLAGGLASSLNPSQAQTSPGAYTPPSNIGEGYNYIPTGQGSIDQLIQQLLQQGGTGYTASENFARGIPSGDGSPISPSYASLFAPGSAGMTATNMLQRTGLQAYQTGSDLSGAALGYLPNLGALLTSAFDPQQGLYNRTLDQLTNQVRAGEAARGLGTTPYGAGIENKALSDFNIDWTNTQLGRMLQGVQGMSSGLQGIGGATTAGDNLMRSGDQDWAASAILQPQLYAQANAPAQALQAGQYGLENSVRGLDLSNLAALSPALSYMSGARQSNALSNSTALAQAQLVGNQNANAAAGISQGLNSVMPWIGQGLSGLYKSIFGNDGNTMSNDPTNYPTATMGGDYSGALEGGANAGGVY